MGVKCKSGVMCRGRANHRYTEVLSAPPVPSWRHTFTLALLPGQGRTALYLIPKTVCEPLVRPPPRRSLHVVVGWRLKMCSDNPGGRRSTVVPSSGSRKVAPPTAGLFWR
ncbi:hypothetical protein E2C01_009663 [Portunus trituberculatus]|uniref:Uncharacterized protein n=1 Tax=Portunus trituberculatus TaxID=210409 RepID=A0A5B7D6L6_PORTR|nr:hypothetical protein [Portunus trituberculatus]